jgi:transposase InsO family protein
VAAMARSTFYYHLKSLHAGEKQADLKAVIKGIFNDHKGRYGYRRITLELRNRGYTVNHKCVLKLMHACGLKCKVRARKYRSYRGNVGIVAPNIINRDFKAIRPNQKWATDVTEFNIKGDKLYLSPIIDMYNNEIISYILSERPTFKQVADMLAGAFAKIHDHKNLILHSDHGWQYLMKRYQQELKSNGVIQSMSRKGNCLDNAVIENFFGIVKTELLYLQNFESVAQFKAELMDYIDYYNNKRIKASLNGMSPVNYRTHSCKSKCR